MKGKIIMDRMLRKRVITISIIVVLGIMTSVAAYATTNVSGTCNHNVTYSGSLSRSTASATASGEIGLHGTNQTSSVKISNFTVTYIGTNGSRYTTPAESANGSNAASRTINITGGTVSSSATFTFCQKSPSTISD